jgi:Mg-chelatase subunit ChlD
MARESRLELVKQSLGMLVEMLRRDDTVGIVAYGTDARVVLPPTRASDGGTIMSAVGALQPGGSTNAAAGLALGYEMARENFVAGGINRVVLASDGRRERRRDGRPTRSCPASATAPRPASSWSRSASAWAISNTCCSSGSPTTATASTRTSTISTRPAGSSCPT